MVERLLGTGASRRRFGSGAICGLASIAALSGARAQEVLTAPEISGDCSAEPGVQLLIDWALGKPVMTVAEILPPIDWIFYTHPTNPLVFRYPPDWTAQAFWANSFTSSGTPIWSDQPMLAPQLTLARIVSPTRDAAFDFANGIIRGQPLTTSQTAFIAQEGLLGETPSLTPICRFDDASNLLAPNWFHADHVGQFVLVSSGVAIPIESVILPGTNVVYRNFLAPREEFESLVRTVLIPILFQFLPGGGTPTAG